MEDFVEQVIEVHKQVGRFTIFLVAPAAMLTFTRSGFHRRAGQLYFYLMILLYASGTLRTLTLTLQRSLIEGDAPVYVFWRNLTFNFFGFSMIFYGYRSIYLMYRGKHKKPQPLDWALAVMLVVSALSVGLTSILDFEKLYPLAVIGAVGLLLAAVETHELLTCYTKKDVLFARHSRYMLASFFYVITVFSIVENVVDGKIKWLWPMMIGIPVIFLTTRAAGTLLGRHHQAAMRWGLRFAMAIPYVVLLITKLRD